MCPVQAFKGLQASGCKLDAILYDAIIDALWGTGMVWAQEEAAVLFRQAAAANMLPRCAQLGHAGLELSLHSATAGCAVLSLHCWLVDLRYLPYFPVYFTHILASSGACPTTWPSFGRSDKV